MRIEPDHLDQAVGDDEHFACHFALATYQVARGEYVGLHFQNEVVKKLRLALVKYRHLGNQKQKQMQHVGLNNSACDTRQQILEIKIPKFFPSVKTIKKIGKI